MTTMSNRVCAAFDIGTNSVKLLVADLNDGVSVLHEETVVTRLGAGMLPNNPRLWESPMHRTIEAVSSMVRTARNFGVGNRITTVGTAALREAVNSNEFVDRLKQTCGLDVRIISGQEEARLSFMAVRLDPLWRSRPVLRVIDIGGGSTEIITGTVNEGKEPHRTSIPLGAVRLTERFLKADPPAVKELAAATAAVQTAFDGVVLPDGAGTDLVGVGGTVTNLAAITQGRFCAPEELHGCALSLEQIEAVMSRLVACTLEERKQVPGLDPRRADIIIAGAILLNHTLGCTGSATIEVSTRGLRWGVLYDSFLS